MPNVPLVLPTRLRDPLVPDVPVPLRKQADGREKFRHFSISHTKRRKATLRLIRWQVKEN
jgi:hypothetical protein